MSSVLDHLSSEKAMKNGDSPDFEDPQLEEQCPDVFQWLSCSEWKGRPRQLPTITLFVDQGRLKAVLNDRETEQTGFWTFRAVLGFWREIQDALCGENIEWRQSRSQGAKRK